LGFIQFLMASFVPMKKWQITRFGALFPLLHGIYGQNCPSVGNALFKKPSSI
jgi:hypothetical protein